MRRPLAIVLLVALGCTVPGAHALAAAVQRTPPTSPRSPCGTTSRPGHYTHIVWIVMENVGNEVVGSSSAPFLNGLAATCGLETADVAVAHPSLPNYIALTSGSTEGVADDGEPSGHPLRSPSIFSELSGRWRSLVESMPVACDRVTSGDYAARHNPAVYFTSLGSTCSRDDVPLRWPLNVSATFTMITPNVCSDMHSCSISVGDQWLSRAVASIVSSPAYRARSLVLFITWDESTGSPTNAVPLYVVAPSIPRGLRVHVRMNHYALLRATETLLGLPLLGAAREAPALNGPLHL